MEFKEYTIEDCCDILDNKRIPLNSDQRFEIPGEFPYYGANGVQGYISKYIFDDDLILIAEDGGNFEQFSTRPIAYRVKGKCWVNNHAHVLKAKSNFSQDFIFYSLEHRDILFYIAGGTRSKLNQRELKRIVISHPPKKREANKIGEILNTTDEAIEQTEKLIAKYQCIKTGLMQDLLTKGIDENGNIRSKTTHKFVVKKGIEVPEEWEVWPVNQFAKITTGSSDTQDKVDDGTYPFFVRSQTIERSDKYLFDGEGVLTSGDGVGVGKIYHYINGKFDFHQRVYLIYDFKPKEVFGKYFFYSFRENFLNEVSKYSAKTTVDSVRLHMIDNMLIPIPKYLEQEKIIKILNEIELFIEKDFVQLLKLNLIKTGLMQDLLSGRVRVKVKEN